MPTQVSAPLDLETERAKYFEYLDGQFLERALGTDLHSDCQFNLTRLLKPIAKQANAKVRQEWTLAHGDDWLTPDVMLSKPNDFPVDGRGYLTAAPHLCVEILSPSQSESELFRKCARYHSWVVPHCWVIDPQAKACFEYHGGADFTFIEQDGILTAGDIRIPVSELFAE